MGIYGLYLTAGITILALLLLLFAVLKPHLKKYKIEVKRVQKKKRVRHKAAAKKKHVWIKIL